MTDSAQAPQGLLAEAAAVLHSAEQAVENLIHPAPIPGVEAAATSAQASSAPPVVVAPVVEHPALSALTAVEGEAERIAARVGNELTTTIKSLLASARAEVSKLV